ncbi:DUF177 domain-containing protein [Labrenzia sp. PHM005]|uniref:YceD family protein n=1 Tax=Labrenzia sp. PHM005 TaxID=2590016 RepID=UPI0011403796|nr:DUF177 domain-containing protein [Labrenzia sp. PHM005]QDG78194.1 DUF177 domain-containing protein [Labrenzia sp. PHM005]
MATETFPYTFKVNAAQVVDKDQRIEVVPGERDLAAIAKAYDLDGIESLKADLLLKPYRKAGLRVVGSIKASVRRTCVVSLEPFVQEFNLDIDRTFEPHSSRPRKIKDLNEDGEIEIDLESLDPPDVITDGVLDLGAVICEELALTIDPFPRKPGVEFEGGDSDEVVESAEGEQKPSPFAALGALKEPSEK